MKGYWQELFYLFVILAQLHLSCGQAMMHTRGLYKPQATLEHHLHTKRFMSACSVHWYLLVPSMMKIATSRGLLWWLAGWTLFQAALQPHSKQTQQVCVSLVCALHCRYMEHNFSEQCACQCKNTHQVDVAEWPNGGCGPCASQ